MKYSKVLELIEEQIGFVPRQADICKILNVGNSVLSNRAKRDSNVSEEEIELIEQHYAIKLNGILDGVKLDYYPDIYASCGNGCTVLSETSEKITVTRETIPEYSNNDEYCVINVKGSSMFPILNDNDKAIIKLCPNEQIIDDRVYLFRFNDEIFIKRLAKNVKQIIVKSENKDYQNIVIENQELKDFYIIGRIVGLIRDLR